MLLYYHLLELETILITPLAFLRIFLIYLEVSEERGKHDTKQRRLPQVHL